MVNAALELIHLLLLKREMNLISNVRQNNAFNNLLAIFYFTIYASTCIRYAKATNFEAIRSSVSH